jgi:hypothetical protein
VDVDPITIHPGLGQVPDDSDMNYKGSIEDHHELSGEENNQDVVRVDTNPQNMVQDVSAVGSMSTYYYGYFQH